jgi:ketosteroid isomerase-like protein
VSQDHVEIVRRHTDAFNRRELDGMLQSYAPDAEVDFSRSLGVEAGIDHGRQRIRDFCSSFFETWERVTVSVDEYTDCGESVVVPTRTRFCGRDGIEVEAYGVFVVILRAGRIARWTLYSDDAEALKAVGLQE